MRLRAALTLGVALACAGPAAGTASAANRWVNDDLPVSPANSSCSKPGFNTISAAIAAAAPNDTVKVCAGTYPENNTVNKPLTILGNGVATVVPPAEDDQHPSSFGGTAPQIAFRIASSDVTIRNMVINGQGNPALTPGKNNFRAGIITDNGAGPYDNNTFDKDKVSNIYRRPIQIVGGTGHAITGNTVNNVELAGAGYGIALFNGDALIEKNKISNASVGGIATNYLTTAADSPSAQIKSNTVTTTPFPLFLSGLHDSMVENNRLVTRGGGVDDIAIIVEYVAGQVTLKTNTVLANQRDAGVWLFHNEIPGMPVLLDGNILRSATTAATNPGDSAGVFLTDDGAVTGDEDGDSYATLTNNTIQGWRKGVEMYRNGSAPAGGRPVEADGSNNCISKNKTWGWQVHGANEATGADADATLNWWGAANGPSGEGPGMGDPVSEHVVFDPFLVVSNCAA